MKQYMIMWGQGYVGADEKPKAEYADETRFQDGTWDSEELLNQVKNLKRSQTMMYEDPSGVIVIARTD